jgi:phosphate transport system permease protein
MEELEEDLHNPYINLDNSHNRTHANRIAATIANGFGEATPIGRGALIASGLVLFVITLLVNTAARLVIARRKEFARAGA